MQAPHMLYFQESNSVNTSRVFHVHSIQEALDIMIKLFADIKLKNSNSKEVIFDIEQALSYYENAFEVRFFEEMAASGENEHILGDFPVKNMKIYNRKMLLDEFVDYLATPPNPNPETSSVPVQ